MDLFHAMALEASCNRRQAIAVVHEVNLNLCPIPAVELTMGFSQGS